ncbi:hypothetical protein [Chitinophaga nivalis]|uniref:Uncharacterized protein n=1 Tax=Chitinophaga nivalis TaxID=2991709 RepID=A0ABT3IG18_9BACT|nr:hypothetical protein [Chitinophaga nivalis]MCW3467406.1 hypothetical protein [Chitinophaga nivalis]MCW3482902.1 hypothetical protein [Chitinophaga nivalis]
MNERIAILKRSMYVCFLLCLQLATTFMPALAAHRHLMLHEITVQQQQQDVLQNLLTKLPVQLEEDDSDTPDVVHATKHRRKTRYYLTASSQQFSIATRIVYLDTDSIAQSNYIPENKTGEYSGKKAFLPAYYTFLFRFTPF